MYARIPRQYRVNLRFRDSRTSVIVTRKKRDLTLLRLVGRSQCSQPDESRDAVIGW